MTDKGPPLEDGEEVVFDHIPSMGAFRRTAVLLIGVTMVPTVIFAIVMPDTLWIAVPLFVSCVILLQERVTIGRYRAWITNRRIIRQSGEDVMLWDVTAAVKAGNGVRVGVAGKGLKGIKLYYPDNPAALVSAILDTKGNPNE